MVIEAYCPLVRNTKADDPTLKKVAEKHGVTPNQVLVRYCLERGWIPLPKSDNAERIAMNAAVYDFELDKEDMKMLNGLNQGAKGAIVQAVSN
jgi:diketogulonate reductase-like aldo/keto reductase